MAVALTTFDSNRLRLVAFELHLPAALYLDSYPKTYITRGYVDTEQIHRAA